MMNRPYFQQPSEDLDLRKEKKRAKMRVSSYVFLSICSYLFIYEECVVESECMYVFQ